MVREQVSDGVFQFKTASGHQIGTADLPNFLKEFNGRNAPHYKRSKWQRRMTLKTAHVNAEGKAGGFYPKSFKSNIQTAIPRTRKLSHKQQQRMERDMAAILAIK